MKKSIGSHFSNTVNKNKAISNSKLISEDFAGIEIEVEGFREHTMFNHWNMVSDGSLRDNGVEFVTKTPMGGDELANAIHEMSVKLARTSHVKNFRTSTHIHVDVTDMYCDEYLRFVLALYSFESLFFSSNVIDRTSSNFCLPLKKSQGLVRMLGDYINNTGVREPLDNIHALSSRWPKYSSINLRSTHELGTIELRCYECLTEEKQLLDAVNRVLLLKVLAKDYEGSYKSFLKHIKGLDPRKFFGNTFPDSFYFSRSDIVDNVRLLQDALLLRTNKRRRNTRSSPVPHPSGIGYESLEISANQRQQMQWSSTPQPAPPLENPTESQISRERQRLRTRQQQASIQAAEYARAMNASIRRSGVTVTSEVRDADNALRADQAPMWTNPIS